MESKLKLEGESQGKRRIAKYTREMSTAEECFYFNRIKRRKKPGRQKRTGQNEIERWRDVGGCWRKDNRNYISPTA